MGFLEPVCVSNTSKAEILFNRHDDILSDITVEFHILCHVLGQLLGIFPQDTQGWGIKTDFFEKYTVPGVSMPIVTFGNKWLESFDND